MKEENVPEYSRKWMQSKERKQELDMIDDDHRRIGEKIKPLIQEGIITEPVKTGINLKIGDKWYEVTVNMVLVEDK